jgi:hypothetical protein
MSYFFLHFVDHASCDDSWQMTNVMHKFFSMCLFLFITLYMFRAHSAHHQERQIVSIQPLVTVILCWWPRCVQVGRRLLIQFVSPDDEHCVLETCREILCGFDRASSIIYGNKMPTSCNRWMFIANLIACSTCFGHHYAHHQELESIIQVDSACRIWCCKDGNCT